jgi:hypothetical protein
VALVFLFFDIGRDVSHSAAATLVKGRGMKSTARERISSAGMR